MRDRDAPGHFHRLARGAYHKLSMGEKQRLVRSSEREQPVVCPTCGTQTMASDLVPHVEHRCPGPSDPGPTSRWIGWRDAMRMGVPRATLSFWASRGEVRFRGPIQGREYLLRDLAQRVADLKRRRKFSTLNRRKP